MKVLVTGGAGNIGKHTVKRLVEEGYSVKALDLQREVSVENAEYVVCDITNIKNLKREMKGCDAVLHLAAYNLPWSASGEEIFRVNCYGTYCVFQAAALTGIKRVVVASSINALGFFFGCEYPTVHYLPIDEKHPRYTTDPYSFSKEILEEIAGYFWRREGISSVCIRMGGVMAKDPQPNPEIKQAVMKLIRLPKEEAKKKIKEYIATFFKSKTPPPSEDRTSFVSQTPSSITQSIVEGILHFWTALDIRAVSYTHLTLPTN